MNKKVYFTIIAIIIISITVVFFILSDTDIKRSTNIVYLARLADPMLYNDDQLFIESIFISKGVYQFRFVPNGDSPETLGIRIFDDDNEILFVEDFKLEGTEQGTESARYFVWDYLGVKEIEILKDQEISIEIDPHGDILGPVTVELITIKAVSSEV